MIKGSRIRDLYKFISIFLYSQIFFFFFCSTRLKNAPVVSVFTVPCLSNNTSNFGSPSVYLQTTHISAETAASQRSPHRLSRKEDRDQYTNAVHDAKVKYWRGIGFLQRKQLVSRNITQNELNVPNLKGDSGYCTWLLVERYPACRGHQELAPCPSKSPEATFPNQRPSLAQIVGSISI